LANLYRKFIKDFGIGQAFFWAPYKGVVIWMATWTTRGCV
jgi:hypothetical protein